MLSHSVPFLKRSHRMRRLRSSFSFFPTNPSLRWSSSSSSWTSAESMRAALRTLSLPDVATDADIKKRFQELAKRHHPDVRAGAGGEEDTERTQEFVEAYQLLRRHGAEERRTILRAGSAQEEAEARAERMYRGRPKAGPAKPGRTAQFNRDRERMRAEAPPWRTDANTNTSAGATPQRLRRRSLFSLFAPPSGTAQAAMDRVFSEYQRSSGFAGMDGSRYDDPKNTTRGGWAPQREMGTEGIFGASPVFGASGAEAERRRMSAQQDYLWRKQRAEEKALLDAAVGSRLVVGIVIFLSLCFLAIMFAIMWKSGLARKNYNALIDNRVEDE